VTLLFVGFAWLVADSESCKLVLDCKGSCFRFIVCRLKVYEPSDESERDLGRPIGLLRFSQTKRMISTRFRNCFSIERRNLLERPPAMDGREADSMTESPRLSPHRILSIDLVVDDEFLCAAPRRSDLSSVDLIFWSRLPRKCKAGDFQVRGGNSHLASFLRRHE